MRVVLFGSPGAGKGTQARKLEERYGFKHISTGILIRRAIREGTPLGNEAQRYVNEGRLVPDELVRQLAEDAIREVEFGSFVLDGYPRTVQQATWLTEFLEKHEAPLDAVISFVLPDDVIVARLSKRRINKATGENYHLDNRPPPPDVDPALIVQRADDKPEAIVHRVKEYKTVTMPVEAYYRERGLLIQIDAVGDFETVHERIMQTLGVTDGKIS